MKETEAEGGESSSGPLIPAQVPCITVEGTMKSTNSQLDMTKNILFKFTTSKYNDKKVIVAHVSDTTDRDELLSLQDSSNYKNRLLASVSHELRTPLNGSINFIEQALNHADISADVKEHLILPSLRCNRMLLSIINDILDFSQIQANKLRLAFETRSITQSAKECIELLELQAVKKGIGLRLESLLAEGKEHICTDHNRVKQIILNLLSNAVKFTFSGEVVLKLQEIPCGKTKGIKISCIDSGIGISAENQKKLFQAFEKFEIGDKIALNSTGAGLGLVISNNLAQRLNEGSENTIKDAQGIMFESEVDKGSHFWFEVLDQSRINQNVCLTDHSLSGVLPEEFIQDICLPDLEYKSGFQHLSRNDITGKGSCGGSLIGLLPSPEHDTALDFNKKCMCPPVLVVDDDAFNLMALEQHLLKLGLRCDWAFNGQEAIQKVLHRQKNGCSKDCEQYKLMLLDCNMPVMDGFETARRLKAMFLENKLRPLKIIACTAFVQQAELNRALEAGMDDYCTKPINFAIIKQKLSEIGLLK